MKLQLTYHVMVLMTEQGISLMTEQAFYHYGQDIRNRALADILTGTR